MLFAILLLSCGPPVESGTTKPNVLFIAVDNLNGWIQLAPIRTPNLERLARHSMLFTRACTASPACNSSRLALLSGWRPSTSGVYGNAADWRRALPGAVTLPQHFMAYGSEVAGAGKTFHHHLGEKDHWEKFALWEKTTHVPYIVAAPGMTRGGAVCSRPAGLMPVYPALIELCGLTPKPELDGGNLVPLPVNPEAEWKRPALTTYMRANHAVRTAPWRYIRYAGNTEELYGHSTGPNEWHNVAGLEENRNVKTELAQWLPARNAEPVPPLVR